jgi:hypothetical protein
VWTAGATLTALSASPRFYRTTCKTGTNLSQRPVNCAAAGDAPRTGGDASRAIALSASRRSAGVVATLAAVAAILAPSGAHGTQCRPRHPLPTIVVHTMGPCGFDVDRMSFAGDARQQAACLLRPVARLAHLGPPLEGLPRTLAGRVGSAALLPDRAALATVLAESSLDRELEDGLAAPLARARDNDPFAPMARYFVIHDTSGPRLRRFPADLDVNVKINNLARFHCSDAAEIAHAVINRNGQLYVGHDFGVPWRATKFERAINFGTTLKGLFLHVEMIQPRRGGPGHGRSPTVAPEPGFTAAQYDRLALLYAVASVRAGEWLIPAFHAVIDNDIRGGHDDPQSFDLEAFAAAVEAVVDRTSGHDLPAPDGP